MITRCMRIFGLLLLFLCSLGLLLIATPPSTANARLSVNYGVSVEHGNPHQTDYDRLRTAVLAADTTKLRLIMDPASGGGFATTDGTITPEVWEVAFVAWARYTAAERDAAGAIEAAKAGAAPTFQQ